jgi:DNA helicase IV
MLSYFKRTFIGFNVLILLFLTILSSLLTLYLYKRNEQSKENIASNKKIFIEALAELNKYLIFDIGYFTFSMMQSWQKEYTQAFQVVKKKAKSLNNKNNNFQHALEFYTTYKNINNIREERNKKFLKEELRVYSHFFDNIKKNNTETLKLDICQREAVIQDEDNAIVIAGAGSGKSVTIVGKVNYISHRYKVSSKEILLISFTKKSADTLAERIGIQGIQSKTFHKFGKDIIEYVEKKPPRLFSDEKYKDLIVSFFEQNLSVTAYKEKLLLFLCIHLKERKSKFEFENQGTYIDYLKKHNLKTYKKKIFNTKKGTIAKRQIMTNLEDWVISTFLDFHNLNYSYHEQYREEEITPTFTITQGEKIVYLYNFSLSMKGDIPTWFAKRNKKYIQTKQEYYKKLKTIKKIHKIDKTIFVDCYDYIITENKLNEYLVKKLTKVGIKIVPISLDEQFRLIKTNAKDEIENFLSLTSSFINLMKSNNYKEKEIKEIISNKCSEKEKIRNNIFVELIMPIYNAYQDYLKANNQIDFNDMISIASTYINNHQYDQAFSYVIIDEFQDISYGRYLLIKSIKENNPNCKIFVVGDDWQSIYRFAGSDINIFNKFDNYFGFSIKTSMETTYRFHEPLISLSSDFILKNPSQINKNLKSLSKGQKTSYEIRYSDISDKTETETIIEILNELIYTYEKIENKEIIILSRYGFDIKRINVTDTNLYYEKVENKDMFYYQAKNKKVKLAIEFMTVHKSKGLEADVVIVINCNSGEYGFPSEIYDDPLAGLLLGESDRYENAEERRLFYVAITRAKEKLFLLADKYQRSKFIAEIDNNSENNFQKKCPDCQTADVVLKNIREYNNKRIKFFGCINYQYGCDYSYTEWENNYNLNNSINNN